MRAIVVETKELCQKEKELEAQIIRNLIHIYKQKIYLEMGYSGLHDFCVGELGLAHSSAQRKVEIVRMSVAVPDLPDEIEKGNISASKVAQVAKFVRQEKKYAGKEFKNAEVKKLIEEVKIARNDYEANRILNLQSVLPAKPIEEKATVLAGGRQVLQIEVDDETLQFIEQMAQLKSHKGFQTKGALIKEALAFYLKKNDPAQKGHKDVKIQEELVPKDNSKIPRGSTTASTRVSRYVPAKLKRVVYSKAGNCCAYVDPVTNKRCASRFRLQIEHIQPYSLGGLHTVENLTLYCQAHNLFVAHKYGLLKGDGGTLSGEARRDSF